MKANGRQAGRRLILSLLASLPLAGLQADQGEGNRGVLIRFAAEDDGVSRKLQDGVQHIAHVNTWPYSPAGQEWKDAYVLALLATGKDDEKANELIHAFLDEHEFGMELSPLAERDAPKPNRLFYAYLLPEAKDRLTTESTLRIEETAYTWVYNRSLANPQADERRPGWANSGTSVWIITESENHNILSYRVAYLMATQLLMQSAVYGPDTVLGDGYTVEQHYDGWVTWFMEYFRQRAREGLDCEVAHPSSYGRMTYGAYMKIAALSDVPRLRQMAENILTLFFAEVVSEYDRDLNTRTGIAATRANRGLWRQRGYWPAEVFKAWGWTDGEPDPNLTQFWLFRSGYRPPAILRAIARDRTRGTYWSTSRRFGAGVGHGVHASGSDIPQGQSYIWYDVQFDQGNSSIRRDVYRTPDYTMSALSFDENRSYIDLVRQTRLMGVQFASDVRDKISFVGAGNPPYSGDNIISSAAINGVLAEGVLIVGRDSNDTGEGMLVYVTDTLWGSREEEDGWIFIRAGDAYAALRLAAGGLGEPIAMGWGYYLPVENKAAPVVLQMGRASDYSSYEQFKDSVKANDVTFEAGELAYTSEAGDHLRYWSEQTDLPEINGVKLELNPTRTYDSPFLVMEHGSDIARISFPGYEEVILDFDYENW